MLPGGRPPGLPNIRAPPPLPITPDSRTEVTTADEERRRKNIEDRAARRVAKNAIDSPEYIITPGQLMRVDPKLGDFAQQVLRKQVGPDYVKLEMFDRIQKKYQAAYNHYNTVVTQCNASVAAARQKVIENPPLTPEQQAEERLVKSRLEAVSKNPSIFPQTGTSKKRTKKLKKVLKKTRRGKGRGYS